MTLATLGFGLVAGAFAADGPDLAARKLFYQDNQPEVVLALGGMPSCFPGRPEPDRSKVAILGHRRSPSGLLKGPAIRGTAQAVDRVEVSEFVFSSIAITILF